MRKINLLLAVALTCAVAFGAPSPSLAQPAAGAARSGPSELETRDRGTNRALLDGLLRRRIEITRTGGDAKADPAAIEFLDKLIAQLVTRAGRQRS